MALPVIAGVEIVQGRDVGFASAHGGLRWMVKNPTPGTGFLGGTSLSRTAPLIAIYQTDAGTGAQFRLTLCSLVISQVSTVAGGPITIVIGTDSTNRYSSGGTNMTVGNMSAETNVSGTYSPAAGFSAKSLPTLTADGSTDQDVLEFTIPAATGTSITVSFKDAVKIGKTGTLMIYAFAATTAPTLTIGAEIVQGQDEV